MNTLKLLATIFFVLLLVGCTANLGSTARVESEETIPLSVNSNSQTVNSSNETEETLPVLTDSAELGSAGPVTDVSSIVSNMESYFIIDILFDDCMFVCYDITAGDLRFIPFQVDSKELMFEESFGIESTAGMSYSIAGSYLLLYSRFFVDQEITVFDITENVILDSWESPINSYISYSEDSGSVIIVDCGDEAQSIYEKRMIDGCEEILIEWNNPDWTVVPRILAVSKGINGYAWVGTIYPKAGDQSIMCYGLIDNAGEVVSLVKREQFDVTYFNGGMVIYDTILPYGSAESQSKKFMVYNADTLNYSIIYPEDPDEGVSRKIQVSSNGKYILTSTKEGCFRVYDTETCNLVAKFEGNWAPENTTQQIMSISEVERAFVVLYHTSGEDKMYCFRF